MKKEKKKLEPGTIRVHGYVMDKPTKKDLKKLKQGEQSMKQMSRNKGKPEKGHKNLPKIIRLK